MEIKVGERYQSDGEPGTVIATNRNHDYLTVIFLQDDGEVQCLRSNGGYSTYGPHPKDLKPIPKEHWVNVYPGTAAFAYDTKKEADEGAGASRVACVKVLEGEFH